MFNYICGSWFIEENFRKTYCVLKVKSLASISNIFWFSHILSFKIYIYLTEVEHHLCILGNNILEFYAHIFIKCRGNKRWNCYIFFCIKDGCISIKIIFPTFWETNIYHFSYIYYCKRGNRLFLFNKRLKRDLCCNKLI